MIKVWSFLRLQLNLSCIALVFNFVLILGHLQEVTAIGETTFYISNDRAHTFDWMEYGLAIDVPEGALGSHRTVEIAVKALVGGRFQLPDNIKLVSGVYDISLSRRLCQPVTVHMQHCVQWTSSTQQLRFLTADTNEVHMPYKFSPLEGGVFDINTQCGSITCDHFCLFCIAAGRDCCISYCCHVEYKKIFCYEACFSFTKDLAILSKVYIIINLKALETKFIFRIITNQNQ